MHLQGSVVHPDTGISNKDRKRYCTSKGRLTPCIFTRFCISPRHWYFQQGAERDVIYIQKEIYSLYIYKAL